MTTKEDVIRAYEAELAKHDKDTGVARRIIEQFAKQKKIEHRHFTYNPILKSACLNVGIKDVDKLKEVITQ